MGDSTLRLPARPAAPPAPPVPQAPPAPSPRRGDLRLSARALRVTCMLGAGELLSAARALPPQDGRTVPLAVELPDRTLRAQINAKSLRRALGIIREHGPDNAVVILQGKLERGDVVGEAGIVAQPRTPKPAPAAATSPSNQPEEASRA